MQEDSLPDPDDHVQPKKSRALKYTAQPKKSRDKKYTDNRALAGLLDLGKIERHGFTHPEDGDFGMIPVEFLQLASLEKKAVYLVVYAVALETVGKPGLGRMDRIDWAPLTLNAIAIMARIARSQVKAGIKEGLARGYIVRRAYGRRAGKLLYEYSIRWNGMETQSSGSYDDFDTGFSTGFSTDME